MSDVKRYDHLEDPYHDGSCYGVTEQDWGDYVTYDDYKALESRLEEQSNRLLEVTTQRDEWKKYADSGLASYSEQQAEIARLSNIIETQKAWIQSAEKRTDEWHVLHDKAVADLQQLSSRLDERDKVLRIIFQNVGAVVAALPKNRLQRDEVSTAVLRLNAGLDLLQKRGVVERRHPIEGCGEKFSFDPAYRCTLPKGHEGAHEMMYSGRPNNNL